MFRSHFSLLWSWKFINKNVSWRMSLAVVIDNVEHLAYFEVKLALSSVNNAKRPIKLAQKKHVVCLRMSPDTAFKMRTPSGAK